MKEWHSMKFQFWRSTPPVVANKKSLRKQGARLRTPTLLSVEMGHGGHRGRGGSAPVAPRLPCPGQLSERLKEPGNVAD